MLLLTRHKLHTILMQPGKTLTASAVIAYLIMTPYPAVLGQIGTTPATDKEKTFKSAAAALSKKGKHEKAIEQLTKAIKLSPQDSELLELRAREYLDNFERKKAIADCSAAIKLNGGVAKYYLVRAAAYKDLGYDDDSLADYDKAIELEPNSINNHLERGLAFVSMQKYEKAVENYDRAIALDPTCTEAYFARANAWRSLKNHEKELEDINKAIDLDPKSNHYLAFRGGTYLRLDRLDSAIADFDKLIEINRADWAGHLAKMSVYKRRKQFDLALVEANQLAAYREAPSIGLRERAELFMLLGMPNKAIHDLNKLAAIMRKKPPIFDVEHSYMATILDGRHPFFKYYFVATKEWDRSPIFLSADTREKELSELVTRTIPIREKLINRAASTSGFVVQSYYFGREFDDEVFNQPLVPSDFALIDKLIAADRDNVRLYLIRGRLYFTNKQFTEAQADFEQASVLEPENTNITAMKAMTLAMLGKYTLAKTEMEKLIAMKTGDRSSFFLLGLITYKLGRWDESVTACTKSIELPGDRVNALILRAAAYHRQHKNDNAFEDIKLLRNSHISLRDFFLDRALACQQLGDKWKANRDLDKAVSDSLGGDAR